MTVDPSVRTHPSAPARHVGSPRTRVIRAARPQLAVMSAQLAAGAGNLLFAVVLARVLASGEYASIVTFLALFVLLHVPSAALSAASIPSVPKGAMPIDTVQCTVVLPVDTVSVSMARRTPCMIASASSRPVEGIRMANSSPPMRAEALTERSVARKQAATSRSA